jgi:hypothetical protein
VQRVVFLERGVFGELVLDELNIVWDSWGCRDEAVESKRKKGKESIVKLLVFCRDIYVYTVYYNKESLGN